MEFSNSNLQWFHKQFGVDTSLSWFANLLMTKAREVYETNENLATPVKVAEQSAVELREELIEKGIN